MAYGLADYLDALDSVRGWLSPVDALLFRLVDEAQRATGVRGDLLEIGVYEGKSAILLGFLLGDDEELVVCDLFEEEPAGEANRAESAYWYQGFSRATFEQNFRKWHERLPVIIAGSSTDLPRQQWPPRFRIVHVDGAHSHAEVTCDVATSRAVSVAGGVVIFDDYRREGLPGVAAAVWAAVATHGLTPLCLTGSKLYATWGPWDSPAAAHLREAVERSGLPVEDQPIGGHPVLCVGAPPGRTRLGRWVPPALVPALQSGLASVRRSVRSAQGRARGHR